MSHDHSHDHGECESHGHGSAQSFNGYNDKAVSQILGSLPGLSMDSMVMQFQDAAIDDDDLDMDMFLAIKTRSFDRVKELIQEKGLQVLHERDDEGHTVTHWAAQTGNTEIVNFLMQNQVMRSIIVCSSRCV
jgi:ankyrin repeat protein